MASIRLNPGEEVVESVRANFGVHGGKLFLTNERVVFKTNMGSEIWGAYLRDLDSYYLQSTFGINANLVIRSGGIDNVFLVPKGAGTNFDECMSRTIQNLNDDSVANQTTQQSSFAQEEDYEIEFDEDDNNHHIDYEESGSNQINHNQDNDGRTNQYAYTKTRGNYRWIIGIICLAVGLFFAISGAINGCNKAGGDEIVGEYRHGVEYLSIDSDGTAVSEYKGTKFKYEWEKVKDGYYTFDTGKVKLDVEYYEASGCVTVNYTTGSVDYYPVK